VAELCASARSSLLKAVEALSGALSNQLDASFDSDDEAAILADLQERFVDRTFNGLKKELDIALDQFQQEFKKLSPIQWDESAQANLMADIRQILDEEGAQKIFDAVDGCGIAVPAMPKFLTEVFETINLDFKIIEALQNAARTHQIVEGLKLKLRKIFNMLWFPALEQRIDTELNPRLIENRLHGILENIHPWKQWHQNISQTVSDVNAEAIESIISAIDDLLTQNRERLRERTGRTMEIHFRRFTLPNLKGMFGKQGAGANELATGMKSKIRALINNPDSRYYEEYRVAIGALSAMKKAQIELNILAAELYQQ
jgi:hypothetical protein